MESKIIFISLMLMIAIVKAKDTSDIFEDKADLVGEEAEDAQDVWHELQKRLSNSLLSSLMEKQKVVNKEDAGLSSSKRRMPMAYLHRLLKKWETSYDEKNAVFKNGKTPVSMVKGNTEEKRKLSELYTLMNIWETRDLHKNTKRHSERPFINTRWGRGTTEKENVEMDF